MLSTQKPLLTIAIPTYNRAKILDLALNRLFPQVKEFEQEIEMIISDNASQDNTQEIIRKNIEKYNIKNIITFRQNENTGYFGNFKKCRELSSGKYFWLLSDNDHLVDGIIKNIVITISNYKQIGFIYLHEAIEYENYRISILDFEKIKDEHREFALMLISAVIVYNNKEEDELIFNKFNNNNFIGFLFLIQSLKFSKKISLIMGHIFEQYPTTVTFDIFKSWIEDISDCINYLKETNIVENRTIEHLVNGFLERVVIHHVNHYLIYGNIFGIKYGKREELMIRMNRHYISFKFYHENILPLFNKSWSELLVNEIFRRGKKVGTKLINKIKILLISTIF